MELSKLTLEAITAARHLFLHYKNSNNQHIDRQVKLTTFMEPAWIRDEKKVGIISAAESLTGMEIHSKQFSTLEGLQNPILATLWRKKDTAKIFVSENENFCHKRFYVAKEICHLLMDDGSSNSFIHESKDIINLITDTQAALNGSMSHKTYPALESEIDAYWAACELLLPPEFTQEADEILGSGTGDSLHKAATHFKVPRQIVEQRYLNENIRGLFDEAHNEYLYKSVSLKPSRLGLKRKKS